jgi:hypothetical protein
MTPFEIALQVRPDAREILAEARHDAEVQT